jgi:Na+/H+ antiporter NhaC
MSAQLVTWFLGIAIFFDDYANTLIVGNTMRPVTDKFKISREKLAYIVDSTAAPVASIAFVTTWIGAELGYIADGLSTLGLHEEFTPYAVFMSSLKYSYYPILTLFFMFLLIYFQKDFGPMLKAETRARTTGQVSSANTESEDEPNMEDLTPVPNAPLKWQYAVFPILTVILVTLFGLFDTGFDAIYSSMDPNTVRYSWGDIWANMTGLDGSNKGFFIKLGNLIGSSDSYVALLWASFAGVVVALVMTIGGKVIKLFDSMHYLVMGFKTMIPAVLILTLAWGLAITTQELHTADFLSNILTGNLNPLLMPGVIFILAAFISFSTGSSWSTMAILFPIAIPTTYTLAISAGIDSDHTMELLYNVIATVLAASVLGDHCSPISDTTILSSLASDCNHIDHVKTQMPYALTVGAISLFCVVMSTYFGGGMHAFFFYILAIVIIFLIVTKIGKSVNIA